MHSLSVRRAGLLVGLLLGGCATEPQVLLAPHPTTQSDALQQYLGLVSALPGVPPTTGNRVAIVRDGEQTLPAMFQALAAARTEIDLEYYTFEDVHFGGDSVGDALVRKLREGVAVNVIYDAYGSLPTKPEFLDRLRQAGAKLLEFHPLDPAAALELKSPNDRDHRKIMVIDGQVAFIGGVNLDRLYENPWNPAAANAGDTDKAYWRDTDARIEGPAAAELRRLFMATWVHENGPALTGDPNGPVQAATPEPDGQFVRIIGSAPGQDRPLYYVAFLDAIHAARRSISLSTGYFVPTHQEREELQKAAHRGVRVRLILPSVSDSPTSLAAGHAAYDDLLQAGVQIFELHGEVLHSKLAAVDGVWTLIGSSNLDRRSVAFNNEVDAVVLGQTTTADVEALFDRDAANSTAITLEQWRHRPFSERKAEFMARFMAWLL